MRSAVAPRGVRLRSRGGTTRPWNALEAILRLPKSPRARERILLDLHKAMDAAAGSILRGEPSESTLQPADLVNEAFVVLLRRRGEQTREQFLATAACVMVQIVVDHARARASRRARERQCAGALDAAVVSLEERSQDLLSLDAALRRLAVEDPRAARIVTMRFIAGYEIPVIARILNVTPRTVERDWRFARAWLRAELSETGIASRRESE
jgi:RNA polymerase sigma-70 factor (ECF subfamily)